ncbi:heterokaryon incompatibility protein-domain-containing protein [Podospora fimiseda]|uniref:Heterokaryon incompatibility protein-domain-containing protein n=1 Tax=Podospora fimiseda TaxID=252190 RepID=A0AAN7BSQ8_9PEZI|nr:heterokaryon incompatibility protein-domain-containing protein [Podospora fimiseda]
MANLCSRCQAFDIQSLKGTTFPWRGYRIQDIKTSVKQGCGFCMMVANALPIVFVDWKVDEVYRAVPIGSFVHFRALTESDIDILQGRPMLKDSSSSAGLKITRLYASIDLGANGLAPLQEWWKEGRSNGTTAEFHVVADPDDPAAKSGDVMGRYIGRSTELDNHCEHIKSWMESCQERHAECLQSLSGMETFSKQDSLLPTRCIQVQFNPENGQLESFLVETAGLSGRYITLSHRWISDTEKCSTTSQNIQQRLNGASLGPLPPLFTDAFLLAARLGIPYVWIDSLCIIQKDAQEWEKESIRMANYYQRSILTVACPANSTTGLFNCMGQVSNLPLPVPLTRLPYRDREGKQQGHFYLHPGDQDIVKLDWLSISKADLFTRGWVYQEAALSRRLACFTSTGLHLRCKNEYPKPQKNHLVEWETGSVTMGPGSVFELSYRRWYEVVEGYSGLNLTDANKDRLVALAGIAEEFSFAFEASNQNQEYVAGLWRTTLPQSLLWLQTHQGSHQRISSIPTWSWASICTAVHWAFDPKGNWLPTQWVDTDCTVVGILHPTVEEVSTGDFDPTAFFDGPIEIPGSQQVSGGNPRNRFPILCIKGKLQPVILGGPFESEQDSRIAAEVTRHFLEYGMIGWRLIASPLDSEHVAGWASLEHPAFQNDDTEEETPLYALHISTYNGIKGGWSAGYRGWSHHAYDVVFVRPINTIPDGFERVGAGRLFGREVDQGFKDAEERTINLV